MHSAWTIRSEARRLIGALVLACFALITAVPLAAITYEAACEKKCCTRKSTSAHACCKRSQSAPGTRLVAARANCCSQAPGLGLVSLHKTTAAPVHVAGFTPRVTATAVQSELSTARPDSLRAGALFTRPPPAR